MIYDTSRGKGYSNNYICQIPASLVEAYKENRLENTNDMVKALRGDIKPVQGQTLGVISFHINGRRDFAKPYIEIQANDFSWLQIKTLLDGIKDKLPTQTAILPPSQTWTR